MIEAIIGRLSPSKTEEMGKPVYFCTACGNYIYKEGDEWKLCNCAEAVIREGERVILLKVKPELRETLQIRYLTDEEGRPFTKEEEEEFLKEWEEFSRNLKIIAVKKVADEEGLNIGNMDDIIGIIDYSGEHKHWLDDHWLDERMDTLIRFEDEKVCRLVHAFWDTISYLGYDFSLEDILLYGVKGLLEKFEAEIAELSKREEKRYQKLAKNLKLMLEDARKFWKKVERKKVKDK